MTPEEHGALLHSPPWRAFRKAIIRAVDSTCQKCGVRKHSSKLEVHHDPPVDETYTRAMFFERWRLVVLCKPCHGKITAATARRKSRAEPPVLGPDGTLSQAWLAWRERPRGPAPRMPR